MNLFRVAAALGVCASSLIWPSTTLGLPFTATDPVNNPQLLEINVASAGLFGGGPQAAQQLIGNWQWSITITETNNPAGTPDMLAVGVTVQHNVKPPGAEHINDADMGLPLAFEFTVTAGNPSRVAGSTSSSRGHPTTMGPEHTDSARLTSLIPVVDFGAIAPPANPMPKNDIVSWSFTVVADHTIVRTPEPSALLLLASGVIGLLYKTVRSTRRS